MLQHTHKKQQHTNSPPGRLTEESIRIESSLENVSTFQRFWPTWVMILQMQLYFFVLVCFCKLFHTKNYCVSEWGQHCNTHYDEKLSLTVTVTSGEEDCLSKLHVRTDVYDL